MEPSRESLRAPAEPTSSARTAEAAGPPAEPVFTSIDNSERVQLVRQQLEQAIINGTFQPGQRLPAERDLVERFGVSRVSVREALRSLQAVGLIEMVRGSGSFVTGDLAHQRERQVRRWLAAHHREVAELMKVRGAIEALGAEEAALRQDRPQLEHLQEVHARFVEAVGNGVELPLLVDLDVQFHEALAAASGNGLAFELTRQLNARIVEARRLTMMPPGRPERSAMEHEQIVRAVLSGDSAVGGSAVRAHVTAVHDAFIRFSEAALTDQSHE